MQPLTGAVPWPAGPPTEQVSELVRTLELTINRRLDGALHGGKVGRVLVQRQRAEAELERREEAQQQPQSRRRAVVEASRRSLLGTSVGHLAGVWYTAFGGNGVDGIQDK